MYSIPALEKTLKINLWVTRGTLALYALTIMLGNGSSVQVLASGEASPNFIYLPMVAKNLPGTAPGTPIPPTPIPGTPLPTPINGLVNGDFEAGYLGWTASSSTGNVLIGTTPAGQAHSGNHVASLSGFGYEVSILTQTVTLPNVTPLYLTFYFQVMSSTGSDCALVIYSGRFYIDLNGQPLVTGYPLCEAYATSGWTKATGLEISQYAGQTVPLVFRAEAADFIATHIYLDDVAISQIP